MRTPSSTLFVPVAVRNNTEDDADALVRERFGEPSWNNPVVRILDADAEDMVPRLHRPEDWSAAAVLGAMTAALGDEAPAWLKLAAAEELAHRRGVETAIFGMA